MPYQWAGFITNISTIPFNCGLTITQTIYRKTGILVIDKEHGQYVENVAHSLKVNKIPHQRLTAAEVKLMAIIRANSSYPKEQGREGGRERSEP